MSEKKKADLITIVREIFKIFNINAVNIIRRREKEIYLEFCVPSEISGAELRMLLKTTNITSITTRNNKICISINIEISE